MERMKGECINGILLSVKGRKQMTGLGECFSSRKTQNNCKGVARTDCFRDEKKYRKTEYNKIDSYENCLPRFLKDCSFRRQTMINLTFSECAK